MTSDYAKLNAAVIDAGASKTIYAYTMPETERIVDEVMDGGVRGELIKAALSEYFSSQSTASAADIESIAAEIGQKLYEAREEFRDMYREAWTQKQDEMHEKFFETWKAWSSPIVKADWDSFTFMYPTAGASEGLREAINAYGVRGRTEGFDPTIHMFEGEYEGFEAYAYAAGIKVMKHDRTQWQSALEKIGPHDQFYLSHPSAIDGKIWDDYDAFAGSLYEAQPDAQLMLDLTYVGSVAKDFTVKADYPNIPTVFFSLSKPMGAYYHRIGGCISREVLPEKPAGPDIKDSAFKKEMYPGLFGNKWFKNLMALKIGTAMMETFGVHDLPRKYKPVQEQAIDRINKVLGLDLTPCDVVLLATMDMPENASDIQKHMRRGSDAEAVVRVCLTPTMSDIVAGKADNKNDIKPQGGLQP